MQNLGLNEIREKYLSFFESKDHLRMPSFSLIPESDASLLLINSGMAPLKPYFSGQAVPPAKRVTTCQKCVRVIDIDRVGKTDRHCTFFEMLGHFSFGDYFKREAIAWTWEFFTKVMGIDPAKLYCSVYIEDDEAWDIWTKEIGVPESHMVRLGKEDNFWDIGSGPCGPCSEIYFDRGPENGCGKPDCAPGCDCDRFVEVGNNVFTQFNNDGAGNYTPLAQKNIDFGMGLERLACVVQGVANVFEVDSITRIRRQVSALSGVEYGSSARSDVSLRIVTDHIRSTTMLVCDGVLPSNEGRGYVLRRLLRRAARHGRLLGIKEPFLAKLCQTVIEESGGAYPDLVRKRDFITRVIGHEEEKFSLTIDAGSRLLAEEIGRTVESVASVLDGATAFKLYDTFGFPLELTLEVLSENGLTLDQGGFDSQMKAQRERARSARAALGDMSWQSLDLGIDKEKKTLFTGYAPRPEKAEVWAAIADGNNLTVVLDKTPFYAESGGQTADRGRIYNDMFEMRVTDVRKTGDGKYLHIGEALSGEISAGDSVTAEIDISRRAATARAHSATHLLQKALRDVLGNHVEQAGSLVEPDNLRFDFTHFSALTAEEIARVNRIVNEKILAGLDVTVREMRLEEAKEQGATALFGEKYGETVRTVRMGDYSFELCGGTHLVNTALAGAFHFRSEASVASGVRRIEAVTGFALLEKLEDAQRALHLAAETLKTSPSELEARLEAHVNAAKDVQRELMKYKAVAARAEADRTAAAPRAVNGVSVVTGASADWDAEALRTMGDYLRDKNPDMVAVLAALDGDKITFLAVCGARALSKGAHAGNIIKAVSKACGGSGGGKPDSAMGGGRDAKLLESALALVEGLVEQTVKA
ncbi:MAG: alanine--tRNA ligase [Oscillospiraceae bacterium]|jgi:alanyl-tRNA synthetase|nr:alanine--tRNA ligase [Oscillospiraceae bacterium]